MEFELEESTEFEPGDAVILFGQAPATFEAYVAPAHAAVTAEYIGGMRIRQTVSLKSVSRA